MNKLLLGLVLGAILGAIDGLFAPVWAPEVRAQLLFITFASSFKSLVAGLLIGWFAVKRTNVTAGVIAGIVIGALCALPFAIGTDPNTHKQYFWEILIPGTLVGLIVGYATQRYGRRPVPRTA